MESQTEMDNNKRISDNGQGDRASNDIDVPAFIIIAFPVLLKVWS